MNRSEWVVYDITKQANQNKWVVYDTARPVPSHWLSPPERRRLQRHYLKDQLLMVASVTALCAGAMVSLLILATGMLLILATGMLLFVRALGALARAIGG